MKILLVVPDTNVGGITTSVLSFAAELLKRGHEVCFLDFSVTESNTNLPPEVKQIFLSGKARYWNLGAKTLKNSSAFNKLFLIPLAIIKKLTIRSGLWNKIVFAKLKESFDVAVAFRQCAPCYSFVLNKVAADKKIGFVHGDVNYMGDISSWQPLMERFYKIAYVSDAVKNGFIEKYPSLANNAAVVYNMIDTNKIIRLSQEENPLDFNENLCNIVTVARINNAEKRINWIPSLCKTIKDMGITHFHWYIIGDGPDLSANIELSKNLNVDEFITFTGKSLNPYKILKDADVFVLPTKSESYGLVITEALFFGVPIISTEYPALCELIQNDVHGLIAQQSEESLCNLLLKYLTDKTLRLKLKENCAQYNFSNNEAYKQFLEAIK